MKLLKLLVIVLLMLVPVALFGAQGDGMKKAKTIDELAKMYDSSACKDCHADVHAEWEKSLHARSIFGPAEVGRTAATIKTTIENGLKDWPSSGVKKPEDVGVRHLMICAKCHLPQLIEAEDSVAQEVVKNLYAFKEPDDQAARNLQKLNIGCLVCHQRNAIVHKWKFGTPDKGTVYGNKDGEHASPEFAKMKKSPYMKEPILCGQCHGQGPNFEMDNPTQCATLYGSYNFSYRVEGGTESCQDCHMKKSKLGHNMQSYRAMGQMAVDMKVEAMAYQWRDVVTTTPAASVQVDLFNKAGHAIPDGWPTPNRVVLYVTAKTKDGKVFYQDQRIYMPIPQQFGTGDKMGRGPYEKSGILRDTSLPPMRTVTEKFYIPVYKESTKDGKMSRDIITSDFTVDVELWYLPYGKKDDEGNAQMWQKITKTLSIEKGGK